MGWSHGGQSLAPPSNVPTGGPAGAGDAYLQNLSSGTSGADSKQIMFNQAQWTGDYLAAHVTRLQASMANFGATTLYMRVIMEGFTGSYFSTNPAVLAPGGGWQNVTFDLTSAGMTNLFGDSTPDSSVLSGIFEVRILSSQAGFSRTGDTQNASLGMDNLRALTLPGDADFDNTVTTTDFMTMATHFNQSGQTWADGDFNFDGVVNALDFNILATNFGQSVTIDPPMAIQTYVPEPTAMMLVGVGAIGLLNASG